MDQAGRNEIAARLLEARRHGREIERPGRGLDRFELDDGYAVYALVDAGLRAQGFRPAGRKLGFTNEATWREFDLSTPIWAYVYDRTLDFAGSRSFEAAVGNLAAPRIEPEVVLKLKASPDLRNGGAALADAVEWVAIGFEIVDCHFADWQFTAPEIVADFGAHSRLIVGAPRVVDARSRPGLARTLEALTVALRCDSLLVDTGIGSNALGGPLNTLRFLTGALDSQDWADGLQPGEIITTGTLTGIPYIHPGERWTVEPAGMDLEPLTIDLV
jgi:2-keto-4-pentenoate hydratase